MTDGGNMLDLGCEIRTHLMNSTIECKSNIFLIFIFTFNCFAKVDNLKFLYEIPRNLNHNIKILILKSKPKF